MVLTKAQMDKIKRFASIPYKKQDQTHGLEHMHRTVKLGIYLARKEKANLQVVRLGAMLHQYHNSKAVENFLKKIKVDRKLAKQIAHCVAPGDIKKRHKPRTIEAKVVFDADTLQVVGPFGIIREISADVGPKRKKTFRQALKHTREIEETFSKALHTKTAKKMAKQPHKYVVNFWKIFDKWDKVRF